MRDTLVPRSTEWIGWDPSTSQIRSWSFEADGGIGEGVWSNQGDSPLSGGEYFTRRHSTECRHSSGLAGASRESIRPGEPRMLSGSQRMTFSQIAKFLRRSG